MEDFQDEKVDDEDDQQKELSSKPMADAKLPAAAQHEPYPPPAIYDASKGSGSDQDDASSEMHADDYGEDDGQSGDAAGMPHRDRLAVIKRQKRLAMNRESARNRRKRKKMLLETLQQQNDDLMRTNRSLLLSKAALTSRVQALEQELAIARTTIAQYQLAAGGPNTLIGRLGMPQVSGLGPTTSHNLQRASTDTFDQQMRQQGPDSLIVGGSDNINRLMQAQLDHLALQQQQQQLLQPPAMSGIGEGRTGSFLPRSLIPHSVFPNEAILRRHGLDLQALSQASRDSALESLFSRHHQQNDLLNQQMGIGVGDGSERSLASGGVSQSAGMRADFDFLSQQLNPPLQLDPRGGVNLIGGQSQAGLRLPDAWLQQSESLLDDATVSNQQQILHELLRQRSRGAGSGGGNWDSKLPPKQSDDSSL